jgi:hypothetical protein
LVGDIRRTVSGGAVATTGGGGGGGSGTEYTEDAAAAANPIGGILIARRKDTLSTSEVSADGDNIALNATNKGELRVSSDAAKAEDAGATSGDIGNFVLGVRNDALSAVSSADADYTQVTVDQTGRLVVLPFAASAARTAGTATTTATTDTSLVAASGSASLKTYITDIQIVNTGASTSLITFKDGSGGSTLGYSIAPAGGGSNIHLSSPLQTSANTAFFFAAATASTTIYLAAQGYKAP